MDAKPTLRDVARRAGVSLGTASNVMHNRAHVSEETRTRVMEAAVGLGYRIKTRTSSPAQRDLSMIGTIGKITNGQLLSVNPFYSHVLAGIERECNRHDLSLMFANVEVDRMNRPTSLPPMLFDRQVHGVLMVGTFLQDTIQLIAEHIDKPVVLVDSYAYGSRFDSVVIDNLNGAIAAVEYLLQMGHRRIGLVGSTPDAYPSIRERRKGYLRALKQHRITDVYIEDSALNREGGQTAARDLLQREPRITAIIACNDDVASGVYTAARAMGRDIPDDLSVIGFDDIDVALQLHPALTTMRVDKMLLGALAVRHLKDRAESPQRPPLTTLISAELVVRGSVVERGR